MRISDWSSDVCSSDLNQRVALAHNGIIENFKRLRGELEAAGHKFETETDTETVVHLISDYLDQQMTPQQAVAATLKRLEGAFEIGRASGRDGVCQYV